jgi:hypothetical protein
MLGGNWEGYVRSCAAAAAVQDGIQRGLRVVDEASLIE